MQQEKKRMPLIIDDGGAEAAGYRGRGRDCVTRAIAIASGVDYQVVAGAIVEEAKKERPGSRRRQGKRSTPQSGVFKATYARYLKTLPCEWTPVMGIGTGCRMHLMADELPMGRLIVSLSKHLTAVIDGVIHDTYDPQREAYSSDTTWSDGVKTVTHRILYRCVYGYWRF